MKSDSAAILVDTGTTLDGKLNTIDSNVDAILVDTGTTLDGKLNTIDSNVDAILIDTAEIGTAGAGLTEAGGDGDHLTEAGGDGDHLTEAGGDGDHLVEAGGDGDHLSAIPEVSADVVKISGSSTAADNLELGALLLISGTAQTGTLSSSAMTTDLSGYDSDRLIGRPLYFNSAPLAGEFVLIGDYNTTSGLITFQSSITEPPTNGTTFVIV